MKLVTSLDDVLKAIATLNESVANIPELAARLGQAHAYYAVDDDCGGVQFGFSKFIGYHDQTGQRYLNNYKQMDGRNTEFALATWFEEVRYGTPAYKALFDELSGWLAQFGKKPREGGQQKLRLMVLKPELRKRVASSEDRKLLDLLIAIADMLPVGQRHQLRAAL